MDFSTAINGSNDDYISINKWDKILFYYLRLYFNAWNFLYYLIAAGLLMSNINNLKINIYICFFDHVLNHLSRLYIFAWISFTILRTAGGKIILKPPYSGSHTCNRHRTCERLLGRFGISGIDWFDTPLSAICYPSNFRTRLPLSAIANTFPIDFTSNFDTITLTNKKYYKWMKVL